VCVRVCIYSRTLLTRTLQPLQPCRRAAARETMCVNVVFVAPSHESPITTWTPPPPPPCRHCRSRDAATRDERTCCHPGPRPRPLSHRPKTVCRRSRRVRPARPSYVNGLILSTPRLDQWVRASTEGVRACVSAYVSAATC